MSGILIKDDKEKTEANETFEKGILRKVVRESWQGNTAKNAVDPRVTQILNEHASRMESLLGGFDYAAICMPNIITNSKRMSYKELVAYLTLMESLGIGYKHWFNSEFANIFLAGLTLKARDTHSAARHLEGFISGMERRLSYYKLRAEKENKSIDSLILEFESKNSGFLRFFRRGELSLLKRMINLRSRNTRTFSKKKERYSNIVMKVKGPKK